MHISTSLSIFYNASAANNECIQRKHNLHLQAHEIFYVFQSQNSVQISDVVSLFMQNVSP